MKPHATVNPGAARDSLGDRGRELSAACVVAEQPLPTTSGAFGALTREVRP